MSNAANGPGLRARVFQHVPFEGPAYIADWLLERGHEVRTTELYRLSEGTELPSLQDFDWLVVMGGPMSANDTERLWWLVPEMDTIASAIEAGKTVLGICLGSQLIAAAAGARVYRNYYREIGWFDVWIARGDIHRSGAANAAEPDLASLFASFPASIPALHWHGETFSLPADARLLARSEACVNQAFTLGERVIGLQFHLEATRESVRALIDGASEDLRTPGPYVSSREEILSPEAPIAESNRYMHAILDCLETRTQRGA
jgi:GMP synthase (glutamine-hydrolysing)